MTSEQEPIVDNDPDVADIAEPALEVADDLVGELQNQVIALQDQLLRAQAEVENIRRRAQEEVLKARKFGTESFAESLIPVRDSLEAALAATDQDFEALQSGMQTTLRQLSAAFERNTLHDIAPAIGDKFDPNVHQAISTLPGGEVATDHIVQVLQKGYTLSDRVLRPALVIVAA